MKRARARRVDEVRPAVRELALLWWLTVGVACAMILYGMPDFRASLLRTPLPLSPGTVVHVMNLHVLVLMWGVVCFAFAVGLWRGRPGSAAERRADVLARLRAQSRAVLPYVLLFSMLGALDHLAAGLRYERAFGEGLYAGTPGLADLIGAPLLLLVGLALDRAVRRAVPATVATSAAVDAPAGPPGRGALWFARVVAVAVIVFAALGPVLWWGQDLHMEALSNHSAMWEALLVAILVLCDDPPWARRALGAWARRNLAPLRLLVALEVFRIVSKEQRYYEMQWLPGHPDHATSALVYFAGRLYDTTVLGYVAVVLVASFVLLARDHGRRGGGRA